jgi:hypothetical protein
MMATMSLVFGAALPCAGLFAPEPAAVQLLAAGPSVLVSRDPTPVIAFSVVDASGKALDPQPATMIVVDPPDLAKVEGTSLVPLRAGAGVVTVATADGKHKVSYALRSAIPEGITLTCSDADCTWTIGESASVKAMVTSGGIDLDEVPVALQVSPPDGASIAADGTLTVKKAGQYTVQGSAAGLGKEVKVTFEAKAEAPAAPAAPAAPSGPCPGVAVLRTWVENKGANLTSNVVWVRVQNSNAGSMRLFFRYKSKRDGKWFPIRSPVDVPGGQTVSKSVIPGWYNEDVLELASCEAR